MFLNLSVRSLFVSILWKTATVPEPPSGDASDYGISWVGCWHAAPRMLTLHILEFSQMLGYRSLRDYSEITGASCSILTSLITRALPVKPYIKSYFASGAERFQCTYIIKFK